MPSYPADAACARSGLAPSTWDADVAGETPQQRKARITAARRVCAGCPVSAACYVARADGGGIRDGEPYPDAIPGWTLGESNSWLGWSKLNHDLHGNEAGYQRHMRDKTPPCMSCLAWARRDAHDMYHRRLNVALACDSVYQQ